MQRAARAAAAVDRRGRRRDAEALAGAVVAAHHQLEPAVRLGHRIEAAATPPEGVGLGGQRPARVDAGVDQQEPAVVGQRGATQHGHQHVMTRIGVHRVAQFRGPAGQLDGAQPGARHGAPRIAAVGLERRRDAALEHPLEYLGRAEGEMDLQQLGPHLFLRAAQEDDVAGHHAGPRQGRAPEAQQLVERRRNVAAMAQIVAQIGEPVAWLEARIDRIVERGQAVGLAVDRRDRPDPPRPAQDREFRAVEPGRRHVTVLGKPRGAGLDGVRRAPQAAASMFSRRSAAVSGSICSTAANSRARRSSAAS